MVVSSTATTSSSSSVTPALLYRCQVGIHAYLCQLEGDGVNCLTLLSIVNELSKKTEMIRTCLTTGRR